MNEIEQLSEKISAAIYQTLADNLPQALLDKGVTLADTAGSDTGKQEELLQQLEQACETARAWEEQARSFETALAGKETELAEANVLLEEKDRQLAHAGIAIISKDAELAAAKAALAEKDAQLSKAREDLDSYATRLQEIETGHSCTGGEAAQDGMALASLQARFFPDYLADLPGLKTCIEEWKEELDKGDDASPTVLSICSNLFTWSVFCRAEGAEADAAASTALFNFSRNFFEWQERKGIPPYEAWHTAYAMQEAFNDRMASYGMTYAVELPELGCHFEASAMVKSPKSIPGGQDISAVLAWALTSTQNNVYKKKSLVLLS